MLGFGTRLFVPCSARARLLPSVKPRKEFFIENASGPIQGATLCLRDLANLSSAAPRAALSGFWTAPRAGLLAPCDRSEGPLLEWTYLKADFGLELGANVTTQRCAFPVRASVVRQASIDSRLSLTSWVSATK